MLHEISILQYSVFFSIEGGGEEGEVHGGQSRVQIVTNDQHLTGIFNSLPIVKLYSKIR